MILSVEAYGRQEQSDQLAEEPRKQAVAQFVARCVREQAHVLSNRRDEFAVDVVAAPRG